MLATLLVPWPRPRLSSDRGAIASPSRCCLLISNASCGLGGFGCAAHTVRKMSLRSPQSRRTYAGLRSWSLDRHQRPIHVLRSRCHGSVPFDPASPLRKERMVRTVPRHRTSSLAATIADFCNKICHKRTSQTLWEALQSETNPETPGRHGTISLLGSPLVSSATFLICAIAVLAPAVLVSRSNVASSSSSTGASARSI